MKNTEKNILCCDKCGKEIKTFTRKLSGVLEEEWCFEQNESQVPSFVQEGDFEGDEQLDLICSECNKPFNVDIYTTLDSLMF